MRALQTLVALAVITGDALANFLPATGNKQVAPLPRSALTKYHLKIRGGAGPLDPTLVAKIATGVVGAQGVISTLAPEPTAKCYGNDDLTPLTTLFMRRIGVCAVTIPVMIYGMMFQDWDMYTAAGVTSTIWCAEIGRSLLSNEAATLDVSNDSGVVWLALNLACALVFFSDASIASTVLKALSIFVIGSNSPLMLFPGAGLKAYGLDKVTDKDLAFCKVLGAWSVAYGIFLLSIANGASLTKALGYAFVPPALLAAITLFVTKETDKVGAAKGPLIAWFLFYAVVTTTLAVD